MEKIKIGIAGVRRGGTYNRLFGGYNRSVVTALCDIDDANLEKAARISASRIRGYIKIMTIHQFRH